MQGNSHIAVNLLAAPVAASYVLPWLHVPADLLNVLLFSGMAVLTARTPDQIECFRILGHRTWSHAIVFFLLLGYGLLVVSQPWPLAVRACLFGLMAGYALHLLADLLSPTGITLVGIGPRLRIALYRTGKLSEVLVTAAIIGTLALMLACRWLHLRIYFDW